MNSQTEFLEVIVLSLFTISRTQTVHLLQMFLNDVIFEWEGGRMAVIYPKLNICLLRAYVLN